MRLTLPEPADLENTGFTDENDIFGYSEFGQRLANLISNINEPLVITLDGSWGSGKSVFIKQWVGLIRKNYGESIVYFDAFANDFHSDAFLALATEIYSITNKTLDENDPSIEEFLNKANKAAWVLASKGTNIALRLGTAGIVNLKDVQDVLKVFENESEKAISKQKHPQKPQKCAWIRNNFPRLLRGYGMNSAPRSGFCGFPQLQKADEERASLEAFRDSLSNVSKSITEKNQDVGQSMPLVFIVDELDRCRPTFALEILEHIKHLFSVENVCFVLVTNLNQMEAVIKKTYGAETEARTYLEKFYQHKIMLPQPYTPNQKQCDNYLLYLWKNLGMKFEEDGCDDLIREEISFLVNAHELSLRQIERVMTNVVFVSAATNKHQWIIPPIVAGLCIMRQKYFDLYARARQNRLTIEDIQKFLKIDVDKYDSEGKLGSKRKLALDCWRYFIDEDPPNEFIHKHSISLERFNLSDNRLSLLPIFTNYIDNLPSPSSHSS